MNGAGTYGFTGTAHRNSGRRRSRKGIFQTVGIERSYIKWTGEGLSRDLRTIPMNEGTYALLDLDEGYSGAVWSMHPMEIIWRLEDIIL